MATNLIRYHLPYKLYREIFFISLVVIFDTKTFSFYSTAQKGQVYQKNAFKRCRHLRFKVSPKSYVPNGEKVKSRKSVFIVFSISVPKGTGPLKNHLQTLVTTVFDGFPKKLRPQWGKEKPQTFLFEVFYLII